MREAVGETVPLGRPDHSDLFANGFGKLQHATALLRVVLHVQAEIEQCELELAHHLHRRLEILRRDHALVQIIRNLLAGLVVPGNHLQRFPFPAPVLKELAGQFDGIPGNTVDAGHTWIVDAGQHVMQAVAEFMEQGLDLVVGQQCRLVTDRRREVAGEVGDWCLHVVIRAKTHGALVHPGPAAFLRPGVKVEIELADKLATFTVTDFIKQHIRVPGIHAVGLFDGDIEEAADNIEHPLHDHLLGKVGLELLLADVVARLAQLFRIVGHVPGLEPLDTMFITRPGLQLGKLLLGLRPGTPCEIIQKIEHLLRALGHLPGQRALGIIRKTKQYRCLVSQRQDLVHQHAVVVFACIRPLVRCARRVGAVHLLAKLPVVGIGHDGVVGRELERQQPAIHLALLGCLSRKIECRVRKPGELRRIRDLLRPCVGRVEHILAEFTRDGGEPLADLLVALLLCRRQVDAREMEITDDILEHLFLCSIE